MSLVTLKLITTIIIIYHGLISVDAKTQNNESLSTLSRQVRKAAELISVDIYMKTTGYRLEDNDYMCFRGSSFHEELTITDMRDKHCEPGLWIVDWDAQDMGESEDRTNCWPVPPSQTYGSNSYCLCMRPNNLPDDIGCTVDDVDGYHVDQFESDIEKNKVMTGMKFLRYSAYLRIEIQQATLLKNGKVDNDQSWKAYNINETEPQVCLKIGYRLRTFFLDTIILRPEYIVTGVRLAAIEKTAGHEGWKLQIRGTKYNRYFNLLDDTNEWFDYTNNFNEDVSYKHDRTEIDLRDAEDFTDATENEPIKDTNRYVRLRMSKLTAICPMTIIPLFSGDPAETVENLPLQGFGLSYTGSPGYGDYIIAKTIPHRSLFYPKIVSSISLRTTSTPTLTSLPLSNISTPPPPKIQRKLQRLRHYPTNVSCGAKSEISSSPGQSVDISGELFVPIDKFENSGSSFFCQLTIIGSLLLFIFLY